MGRYIYAILAYLLLSRGDATTRGGHLSKSNIKSRVSDTMAFFQFYRLECLNGYFLDESAYLSPIGQIRIGDPSSMCLYGNGLTNKYSDDTQYSSREVAKSTMNFKNLYDLRSTYFTLETWLRFPVTQSTDNTSVRAILSISSAEPAWRDLLIYQRGSKLGCIFRALAYSSPPSTTDSYTETMVETDLPKTSTNHVVITLRQENILIGGVIRQRRIYKLYINAVHNTSNLVRSFDKRASLWNPASYLHIFSEPGVFSDAPSVWEGTIYLLAMYDRVLSDAEIARNYQARISNSVPVAFTYNVTVQENGEVGSHYDNPSYYLQPVPTSDLVTVSLDAVDADNDVDNPNYDPSAPPLQIYLATLPTKGLVYHINGSLITTLPALIPTSQVRYRPRWKEVSWPQVYDNLTFYAVDGITGQISNNATLSIIVKAVHGIPQAQSTNITARARSFQIVTLDGTVADPQRANLTSVWVTSLPKNGDLYYVSLSSNLTLLPTTSKLVLSGNGLPNRTLVPLLPTTNPNTRLAQVAYLYTKNQSKRNMSAAGMIDTDSFTFIVGDSYNATSIDAQVNITVNTALEARVVANNGIHNVLENNVSDLVLYGFDYQSIAPRNICFQITSLPTYGNLSFLSPHQALRINVGDIIPGQYSSFPYVNNGVRIRYRSQQGYFSSPQITWNGTMLRANGDSGMDRFAFRVLVCNDTTISSPSLDQFINITNVNDPTGITVPSKAFSVLSLGSLETSSPTSACSSGCALRNDTLVLNGWEVHDPDMNVDPIVVKLWADFGLLRLNPKFLSLADFTSKRYCHALDASWTCQGSGEDQSMIFVTSPSDLYYLLEGMEYRCIRSHVIDTIHISIYDGPASEKYCLPITSLQPLGSDRSKGCLVETANITVDVTDSALFMSLDNINAGGTPTSLWMASIGLGSFVVLLLLTTKNYRFIK